MDGSWPVAVAEAACRCEDGFQLKPSQPVVLSALAEVAAVIAIAIVDGQVPLSANATTYAPPGSVRVAMTFLVVVSHR